MFQVDKPNAVLEEGGLYWIVSSTDSRSLEAVPVEYKRIDPDDPIHLSHMDGGGFTTVRQLITERQTARRRAFDLEERLTAIQDIIEPHMTRGI